MCALCRCTTSAAHRIKKLTILQLVILLRRQELPYWGNPSTLPPREEELVQLLSYTFAGPIVHTSVVPGERVQLHPRGLRHLLLHGGHQQGPYRIYIANVVLISGAKRQTYKC